MKSIAAEIMDRIPTPDGGFRRRFTAGLIFFLIIAFGVFVAPGFNDLANGYLSFIETHNIGWKILGNASFTVILFSIIFTVGTIIEVFSYVFLGKIFSVMGGQIAYRGLANSLKTIARSNNDENERPSLDSKSDEERETFTRLPDYVKDGIVNPYGRKFDVAFRYLLSIAPDDEKSWLIKLDGRNQNLFSMMSAVLIAVSILIVISVVEANSINTKNIEYQFARQAHQTEIQSCVTRDTEIMAYARSAFVWQQDDNIATKGSTLESARSIERLARFPNDVLMLLDLHLQKETQSGGKGPKSEEIRVTIDRYEACIKKADDDLAEATPAIAQITIFLIKVATAVFPILGFILIMSVVYSYMLRDSISSALEMMSLRKGVVADEGQAPGASNFDSQSTYEKKYPSDK